MLWGSGERGEKVESSAPELQASMIILVKGFQEAGEIEGAEELAVELIQKTIRTLDEVGHSKSLRI